MKEDIRISSVVQLLDEVHRFAAKSECLPENLTLRLESANYAGPWLFGGVLPKIAGPYAPADWGTLGLSAQNVTMLEVAALVPIRDGHSSSELIDWLGRTLAQRYGWKYHRDKWSSHALIPAHHRPHFSVELDSSVPQHEAIVRVRIFNPTREDALRLDEIGPELVTRLADGKSSTR